MSAAASLTDTAAKLRAAADALEAIPVALRRRTTGLLLMPHVPPASLRAEADHLENWAPVLEQVAP